MSTPTEDAARQAAQQLAAVLRALIDIARTLERARAQQAQQPETQAQPSPDAERYAQAVERAFGPQVRQALTGSSEWPRTVEHLGHLDRAGINPDQLFSTLATITRQSVPQAAPAPDAGPPEHTQVVRQHVTDRAAAEALTSSPQWPQIASQLRDLHQSGIDVPQLLAAAGPELSRLNGAIAAAWQRTTGTTPAPQPQAPAQGPAAAQDRQAALQQAGISTHDNERLVRMARDVLPPREAALLVASNTGWPRVAQAMRDLEARGIAPAARLERMGHELTAQTAAGARFDVPAAALRALAQPAPGSPTTSGARAGSVTERARLEPDANLRRAADIAGSRGVISARMLMAEGFEGRETGRLLTELERHRVIGPLGDNGTHPARASSATEAQTMLAAGVGRELATTAATTMSTTAAGPPRPGGPAAAAAARPADAPARATGPRR